MRICLLLCLAACGAACRGTDDDSAALVPSGTTSATTLPPNQVVLGTELGEIAIELFPDDAPDTVANFLSYVDRGFYDGTDGDGAGTFYRAVPDFVLQGGGVRVNGSMKDTDPPIANEARDSGLSNALWTVAMARTADPDSATTEFFINLDDNSFLDPDGSTPDGYAVFGRVVGGKPVVNAIMDLPVSGETLVDPVEFTEVR